MTVRVTWGSDPGYLMRHVEEGVTDGDRKSAQNYYLKAAEHGEPPGYWMGLGAEGLGLELRSSVTQKQMESLYEALRHPETGERLGTPLRRYKSYQERLDGLIAQEPTATPERRRELEVAAAKSGREARTYADVTLSPAKSVSIFHAALEANGRHDDAQVVWECLNEGAEAALGYLQREAGYSRAGYHGAKVGDRTSGRWVDAHEWTVAAFRHHTSREGDPQLHMHLAVLNRALNPDGQYRSLDSQAVQRAMPAAAAMFHRGYEQAMMRRLGVRFMTRPDGKAREIVGVDPGACELFSSRRRAISTKLSELVAAYTEAYGKEPSQYVTTLMAEHATLKTRKRKLDHPPTRAELLQEWEQRASDELGQSLQRVLDQVDGERRMHRETRRIDGPAGLDSNTVIAQAMAEVDRSKTVWTRHDLIGQLDRYLPDDVRGLRPQTTDVLLNDLADRALRSDATVCLAAAAVSAAMKNCP